MSAPDGPGMLAPVAYGRVRVVVELEPGDPVSGSAAREGEAQVPFEGMLAFLSLFERLRAGSAAPGGDSGREAPQDLKEPH